MERNPPPNSGQIEANTGIPGFCIARRMHTPSLHHPQLATLIGTKWFRIATKSSLMSHDSKENRSREVEEERRRKRSQGKVSEQSWLNRMVRLRNDRVVHSCESYF